MLRAYTRFLLRFRLPISLLLVAGLIFSARALPRLGLDLSIGPLLEATEQDKRVVEKFNRAAPPRHFDVVIDIEFPNPIGPAEVDQLAALTKNLEALPEVGHVMSILNTRVIERGESGRAQPRLVSDLIRSGVPPLDISARHPLIRESLISKDGRSTPLLARGSRVKSERWGLLGKIEAELARSVPPGVKTHLIGSDLVERGMDTHMRRDMLASIVRMSLLFLFLLPLLFGTFRGSIAPLLTVNAATLYFFGLLIAFDVKITLLEVAVPGLIIIIGLCDAIHMLHRFEEIYRERRDRSHAIEEMMTTIGPACFYTSFTTALGFISLLVAKHQAVRNFGVKATVAVMIAYFTVMIVLPILLSLWPIRHVGRDRLSYFKGLSFGRPKLTLALCGLVILASGFGLQRVVIDAHYLEELPKHDPAVHAMRWHEENFTGLLTLDAKIEGDLSNPDVISAVERLQAEMMKELDVTKVDSYTVWLHEAAGRAEPLEEPDIRRAMVTLGTLGASFPRHVINQDYTVGRIIFQTPDIGTRRYLELKDRFNALAKEILPEGAHSEIAGYALMAHESSRLVATTMLQSVATSLVTIIVFIMIAFRSVKIGLLSIPPNVLPILIALGINGWMDIPLRIGIVMIYCLGLGLAVDDTIHLIARFVHERKLHPARSLHDTILVSLRATGKAMIATSATLAGGALCYLPSDFQSLRDVGMLLTAIVLSALIADLFLTPLMLKWAHDREERSKQRGSPDGTEAISAELQIPSRSDTGPH